METSIPWLFWLFPIAFTVHNIEEALWFPAFSKSTGKFHKPVGTFEFTFAVLVLTLLAVAITLRFYASGRKSLACYLYFAFNLGMLVNVFVPHLAAAIVLQRYSPGLATGILLLVPATLFILRYGFRNEYFLFPKFWFIALPFAGLVIGAIPVLFKVGKYLQKFLG
jgi:hypothetical protein